VSGAELRHLEAVAALAAGGDLDRVADELRTTAAALTTQVASVESELGHALFSRDVARDRHAVVLTGPGVLLLPRVTAVLESARALRDLAADLSAGRVGVLRVGSSAHGFGPLTPALTAALARTLPGTRVEVVELPVGALGAALRDGQVDAVITYAAPARPAVVDPPPVLVDAPFLTEPRMLVLPPDHPLAAADDVLLDSLLAAALPVAAPGWSAEPEPGDEFGRLPREIAAAGLARPARSVRDALDRVLEGDHGALLPLGALSGYEGAALAARDFLDAPPCRARLAWRADAHPVAAAVREVLAGVAAASAAFGGLRMPPLAAAIPPPELDA
jgi:DNA-binding transcriptional LysR family regulator